MGLVTEGPRTGLIGLVAAALEVDAISGLEQRGAMAKDRDGNPRKFPLLGVSAVAVLLEPERNRDLRSEQIISTIANHKGLAKANPERLCFVRL